MSPRLVSQEFERRLNDFSKGLISSVSERGIDDPEYVRRSENLLGRPFRALGIRGGSRDISQFTCPEEPHSLMKFYSDSGSKAFVGAGTHIYELPGYTLQTLPVSPSSDVWDTENLDGALITTQRGGLNTPIFYDGTWKLLALPKPTLALTFAADSAGGSVDVGDHFYRVRWRYTHGSSLAGASTSASHTVSAPNQTVNINANLVPASPRSDFVGWTLERTKINGAVTGPYYRVAEGTASTYADTTADADLGYEADDLLHGEPPHLDGMVVFQNRIFGWAGDNLLISHPAGGYLEATGIANFDAENTEPINADDGDAIQNCVVHGDQLIINKRHGMYIGQGDYPDGWRVVPLSAGSVAEAGSVGPRAAVTVGNATYVWADGGLFRYQSGRFKPFGWIEVGHYKDLINRAALDTVVLTNFAGDFLLCWIPIEGSTYPNRVLAYDTRFDQWWHVSGWRARDALVQKDAAFGDARLLFADPALSSPITPPQFNPSAIAWHDPRAGGAANQVFLQQLSEAGATAWAADGVAASTGVSNSLAGGCICSDGGSGWYVGWRKGIGSVEETRLTHILSDGTPDPLWGANGVLVSSSPTGVGVLEIAPDASGGVLAIYNEFRATNIRWYAQRYSVSAAALWTAGGVEVVGVASGSALLAALIADGAGGLFAHVTFTPGTNYTSYVQRLDANGAKLWGGSGVTVGAGNAAGFQTICSDMADGIIVSQMNACVLKRYGPTGTLLWTSANLNTGSGGTATAPHALVSDGASGAILAWTTFTADSVRAQRVDSSGAAQWAAGGVQLSASRPVTPNMAAVQDGLSGACIVWGVGGDVLGQRIDSAGLPLWGGGSELTICNATGTQDAVTCCTDGLNGAIVCWRDQRSGIADIFAMRVTGSGVLAWTPNGVAVCSATGAQLAPSIAFTGVAEGQSPSAGPGYHVWSGFDGFRDERAVTGDGGIPVRASFETAKLDEGSDYWKRLLRLRLNVETDVETSFQATIITDPPEAGTSVPLANSPVGDDWALDDLDPNPDVLFWDTGDWARESEGELVVGIPPGVRAKRYSVQVSADVEGNCVFSGVGVDGLVLPERRKDR